MKRSEDIYSRALGVAAIVGFILLLVAVSVTVFGLLPSAISPEEWREIWREPASVMRSEVLSLIDLTAPPFTAEELGFVALGFFGAVTAMTLLLSIPVFFAEKRTGLGVLGLVQLAVLAAAVWISAL